MIGNIFIVIMGLVGLKLMYNLLFEADQPLQRNAEELEEMKNGK